MPGTGCSVVARLLTQEFGGKELGKKHDSLADLLEAGVIEKEDVAGLLVVANVRNPFDRLVTYYQRLKGSWLTDEYFAVRRRQIDRQKNGGKTDKEIETLERELEQAEKRSYRRANIIKYVPFNWWLPVTLARWRLQIPSYENARKNYFRTRLFPMLDGVDVAIRQESLETSLKTLFTLLGWKNPVVLERKNITPGKKPYSDYFNAFSAWLVKRIAGDALQEFGYKYDQKPTGTGLLIRSPKGEERLRASKTGMFDPGPHQG